MSVSSFRLALATRRLQPSLLLTLLVLGLLLGSIGEARAQADPFTVTGVEVDVTADSANAARDRAIMQAQREAYSTLYSRLSTGGGRPPPVDDLQLQRLVRGFEIQNERVSDVRYAASFSVTFDADSVRALFGEIGTRMAEPKTRPYVILPVVEGAGRPLLWEDRTPWRNAWEDRAAAGGVVPILVPLGELSDVAAVTADEALAGSGQALTQIENNYTGDGAVVAIYRPAAASAEAAPAGEATVQAIIYRGGRPVDRASLSVPAGDGAAHFERTVNQVMSLLERAWREGSMSPRPAQSFRVVAPLTDIQQWLDIQRRLQRQTMVDMQLDSLSRSSAEFSLKMRGDGEQLRAALGEVGLDLTGVGITGAPLEIRLGGPAAGSGLGGAGGGFGDAYPPLQ